MTSHDIIQEPPESTTTNQSPAKGNTVVRGLVGALVLLFGASVSYYWLTHKPQSKRHKPKPSATLVKVMQVRRGNFLSKVKAMGTVIPARKVELAPRVGGQIIRISPNLVPGGRFAQGEAVAWIDPEDYRLALRQREAELDKRRADIEQARALILQHQAGITQAKSDLKLEMGRQQVAQDDFRLLGSKAAAGDKAFILRKPQLAAAKARLASHQALLQSSRAALKSALSAIKIAEAALEQAKLNLKRTTISAPFNCMVSARFIEQGSQVAAGKIIAMIVGTDEYWVQATLPVPMLKWIDLPPRSAAAPTKVRIMHQAAWGNEVFRKGETRQLEADLEANGRMARLIVALRDPICLQPENRGQPPLILGSFVHLIIDGKELGNVFTIPASAIREGGSIWVMTQEQTLEIRKVEIAWQDQSVACIAHGLENGQQVVVSDLATPMQGMRLRVKARSKKQEAKNKNTFKSSFQ